MTVAEATRVKDKSEKAVCSTYEMMSMERHSIYTGLSPGCGQAASSPNSHIFPITNHPRPKASISDLYRVRRVKIHGRSDSHGCGALKNEGVTQ